MANLREIVSKSVESISAVTIEAVVIVVVIAGFRLVHQDSRNSPLLLGILAIGVFLSKVTVQSLIRTLRSKSENSRGERPHGKPNTAGV